MRSDDDNPHAPGYCLERAVSCERLAETAMSEENRKILLSLAARWRALAETDGSPPNQG
jgi:hypothetical protein